MTPAFAGNRSLTPMHSFAEAGPTVRRIALGAYLRGLREERRITVDTAARQIRASPSKISRIELGRVWVKNRDLADLLALYGVTDQDLRDSVLRLADQARQPGWWHRYEEVLPSWFEVYIGLEGAASGIRTYEVLFVPGLLQTDEYAHALIRQGHPEADDAEIETRLGMRVARQDHLDAALRLWAIVDEAALRRVIGGRRIMRAQLEHLLELTHKPNITFQIVPFSVGAHAAGAGSFTLLRFREAALPDIVYIEHLDSAVYLDKPEETSRYLRVMDRLCIQSATPDASRLLLGRFLADL